MEPQPHQSATRTSAYPSREANSDNPITDRSREEIRKAQDEARAAARDVGQRIRDDAARACENGKHEVAEHLRAIGAMGHAAADRAEEDEHGPPPRYASTIADTLEDAADYVDRTDLAGLRRDASQLARDHPALVLGGLVLAGFVAGRVLTASSRRAEDDEDQTVGRSYDPDAEDARTRATVAAGISSPRTAPPAGDERTPTL